MDLKKYLDSRNFVYKEFAEMVGISPSALANYMYKRREPRPAIRKRIVQATRGLVSIEDLLTK